MSTTTSKAPVKASTSSDAASRLAELRDVQQAADAAVREATEQSARRKAAVLDARAAVAEAYANGQGEADAEATLASAEHAAADSAQAARIDGLTRAARSARADVQRHIEAHLAELVEDVRPRAEQAVASVNAHAHALIAAFDEWAAVSRELSTLTAGVAWFRPHERIPAFPFGQVRGAVEALTMTDIPLPMPTSLEDPGQEQARLKAEHEQRIAQARRVG